jgi:hypothetical protein
MIFQIWSHSVFILRFKSHILEFAAFLLRLWGESHKTTQSSSIDSWITLTTLGFSSFWKPTHIQTPETPTGDINTTHPCHDASLWLSSIQQTFISIIQFILSFLSFKRPWSEPLVALTSCTHSNQIHTHFGLTIHTCYLLADSAMKIESYLVTTYKLHAWHGAYHTSVVPCYDTQSHTI